MLAFLDLHPHSYWFSTTEFLEPSPKKSNTVHLGVGFKYIFSIFTPYLRKIPILTNIFQLGWNHQLVLLMNMFLLARIEKKTQTPAELFISRTHEKSNTGGRIQTLAGLPGKFTSLRASNLTLRADVTLGRWNAVTVTSLRMDGGARPRCSGDFPGENGGGFFGGPVGHFEDWRWEM